MPTFIDTFGIISESATGVASPMETRDIGETNAFKTSTGAEIRFFMPVLNVPFRLIFAMNPSRGGRARQQPAAGEEVQVPVCGRLDVLTRSPVSARCGQLQR